MRRQDIVRRRIRRRQNFVAKEKERLESELEIAREVQSQLFPKAAPAMKTIHRTLFAVAAAGIFPAIHVGRPWVAYWLFPYPNTMRVWPQFRSPLMWDVFAVSTYATISALFWFTGLIPDFATLRDRSEKRWMPRRMSRRNRSNLRCTRSPSAQRPRAPRG